MCIPGDRRRKVWEGEGFHVSKRKNVEPWPEYFLQSCSPASSSPGSVTAGGLFFAWCGAGHLSHNVELHGVLLAHSSSLSGSLFMAALSSNILAGPSGLLSSGNPMRVPSVASSRSLRKMWNRTGPRINSCDTHYWPSGSI